MSETLPATGHLTWRQIDDPDRTRRKLVRAEGVYLYYDDGSKAIDASGGPICVGIGHGRDEVVQAATAQMKELAYGFEVPVVGKLLKQLKAFAPGDLNRTYVCSGGSEAVEAAIRFTRHYFVETGWPSRYKIISRWVSYHGNTLGAASLSGGIPRRIKFNPLLIPFPHIETCYCFRCPFHQKYPDCRVLCADKLEEAILREGPDTVAAFIAEPVIGATAGCVVPVPEYFPRIREICDKYGVLLIADEVMTGFGRTGKNFAMEHWDVLPDIMTMAKGMTSGYAPMGGVMVRDSLMAPAEPRVTDFGNIHTYSYHPVSAAVASTVIDILVRENLVQRSAEMGRLLHARLEHLRSHRIVADVRGLGLFAGIELVRDAETAEPFGAEQKAAEVMLAACRRRGVALYSGSGMVDGVRGDHVMIAPPFIVTEAQIDEIVGVVAESLDEVAEKLSA
jgi:adenosylmethionine-8-amino-7-oxononanoate aminotransferase